MRRVTSVDIANRAGVSRTTVSFVINGRTDLAVAPETRKRVLQAAEELGYVPNATARVLLTGCTQTIAICVERLNDPHYADLLNVLIAEARLQGYHSLLVSGQDDSAPLLLAEGRVDGIFVFGDFSWKPRLDQWVDTPVPIVCVGGGDGREIHDWPFTYVYWNDTKGIITSTEYLLQLGHEKIAMMVGIAPLDSPKARGFEQAMQAADRTPIFLQCENEADLFQAGRQMMQDLREHYPEVTAIVCRQDLLAVGALAWAAEHNVKIPDDISIIGYNGIPLSGHTVPKLTTIATPASEAGMRALKILLTRLKDQPSYASNTKMMEESDSPSHTSAKKRVNKLHRIEIPLRLVERNSVARLPAKKRRTSN